jgi:hemin uptake protein HemP
MNASTRITASVHGACPTLDCPHYDARDLTQNGARAVITLDGQTYFLRITRAEKLILTK